MFWWNKRWQQLTLNLLSKSVNAPARKSFSNIVRSERNWCRMILRDCERSWKTRQEPNPWRLTRMWQQQVGGLSLSDLGRRFRITFWIEGPTLWNTVHFSWLYSCSSEIRVDSLSKLCLLCWHWRWWFENNFVPCPPGI